ncbi:MAG: hypothetical protein H6833_04165 [Planctomycetes bacterium]|nr:hypothetical protein [Planctomycetota bacterium]
MLFALVGALALIVLVGLPGPRDESAATAGFDSRTGQKIQTVWDLLANARQSGDARIALSILDQIRGAAAALPLIRSSVDLLRRELDPLVDSGIDDVVAASLRAVESSELWSRIESTGSDVQVARDTEAFFAPFVSDEVTNTMLGVDARAAKLLDRASREDSTIDRGHAVALARSYRALGRPRAARRWTLRALRSSEPTRDATRLATTLREDLIADALAYGRLHEAWLLQDGDPYVDESGLEAFFERRARIASWLGFDEERVDALERVILLAQDPDTLAKARTDLVALYPAIGRPEAAVPHAVELARNAGEAAKMEAAGYVALESGRTDEGLDILSEVLELLEGDEQRALATKIADFALQDLRPQLAVTVLRKQLARDYDTEVAARLDGLYRRLGMDDALIESLEARLESGDASVGSELLSLLVARGDRGRVARVALRLAGVPVLVARSHQILPRASETEASREIALPSYFGSTMFDSRIRPEALLAMVRRLRPLFDQPQVREVVREALARFPRHTDSIDLRAELVDLEDDPVRRNAAARELAASHPERTDLVRLWIERASWTENGPLEIEARERLLAMEGDDRDNLRKLGDLYEAEQRREDALSVWRRLADAEGVHSPAQRRLIQVLFALGRTEDAIAAVSSIAESEGATSKDRLEAADLLFAENRPEAALAFYRAVLRDDDRHAIALLRCGQILSWGGESNAAIPYFEKRLAVTSDDRASVLFDLGEALFSATRISEARRTHERAIEDLRAISTPTVTQKSMLAKAYLRVGRARDASLLLHELAAECPTDVDLVLDHAEACILLGDMDGARGRTTSVLAREPDNRRALRIQANAFTKQRRYSEAIASYERFLAAVGEDAYVLSDLAHVRELEGDYDGAHDGYRRWLTLRPDASEASTNELRLFDKTATTLRTTVESMRIGRDHALEIREHASLTVDDGRTRVFGSIGHGEWSGRAAGYRNGSENVRSNSVLVDVAAERRHGGNFAFAGGVFGHPGVEGAAIGAWTALRLVEPEPYRLVEGRLAWNELWDEPAAGVGLEGRVHSLELATWMELGASWWVGGDARLRHFTVRPDDSVRRDDTEWSSSISFGRRLSEGPVAVVPTWRSRHEGSAREGIRLESTDAERGTLAQAWLSLQSSRMLEGERLQDHLPVAARSDSLQATVAAERFVANGLGLGLTGHVGHEFWTRDFLWGVSGSTTWRPSRGHELSLTASSGSTIGRAGNQSSVRLGLQWTVRW